MSIEYVKHFDMPKERIDLIYSMLLNIQSGVNEVVENFDHNSPDWEKILEILNENESELVYILVNAKDQIEKKKELVGENKTNGK